MLVGSSLGAYVSGLASMQRAIDETNRRREKQVEFNRVHGIEPRTIRKAVQDVMEGARSSEERGGRRGAGGVGDLTPEQVMKRIKKLEQDMYKHARNLEFEQAARVRDQLASLKQQVFGANGNANVVPLMANRAA